MLYQQEVGRSILLYLAQLIVVPLVVLGASLPAAIVISSFIEAIFRANDLAGTLFVYAAVTITGLMLGRLAMQRRPTLYATGCRLWILPLMFYVSLVSIAMIESPAQVVPQFFTGRSSEGLGVLFVTLPTLADCSFSLGMILANGDKIRFRRFMTEKH